MTLASPARHTSWMLNLSNRFAVIGLGNTLRRDDGIGILILESLRSFYKRDGVDYLNFGIASFDLLHRMKEYDKILLIDGIDASLKPTEAKIFGLEEIAFSAKRLPGSSHELNLKNIFDLYKKLDINTKIYVAGIQVMDSSFGEGISEILKKNLDKTIKEINLFIDENLV